MSEWQSSRCITPHDGPYLCFIVRNNECGTVSKYCKVLNVKNIRFEGLEKGERVTHWMHLPPEPERTVTLL